MPLLFVSLIAWHGISRILIIYLVVSLPDPYYPTGDEVLVGNLFVWNGLGFVCLFGAWLGCRLRFEDWKSKGNMIATIGIPFVTLSASHDVLAGLEIAHSDDYIFRVFLLPLRELWPPLIDLLIYSMYFLSVATLIYVLVFPFVCHKRRRDNE